MNTNPPATPPPAPAGNFLTMLQHKTDGVTLAELDAELSALIEKVQDTGRKGALTYKVMVLPNAKAGVTIEDAVDVKAPKAKKGVSFFWVGPAGALLRNDPKQGLLNLRVVTEADAPPKVAAEPAQAPRAATA